MTATIRALKPLEDTPAARLQRLRLEARAIAAADMEALIADLGAMAVRCVVIGDPTVYLIGAPDLLRRPGRALADGRAGDADGDRQQEARTMTARRIT